jgi:transcription antitermination protein NusB
MSNRHLARTLVLQSLFQWDFNQRQENPHKLLDFNRQEFAQDLEDQGFSGELLNNVLDKVGDIDKLITKYAPEWPIDQITIVDRNVLRMGIYELKYAPQIPPKVAIDEAIELAKNYSGTSSGKFVNGVLGSIYKDMQENGEKKELEVEPARQYSAGGVVFKKAGNDYKFILVLDAYNKYTFPKGHIEDEEDKESAAQREVCEEVGIKNTKSLGYLGSIDIKVNEPNKRSVPKTVFYYLIETTDDKLQVTTDPEVNDAIWTTKEEALGKISYENAKEIFNLALNKLNLN